MKPQTPATSSANLELADLLYQAAAQPIGLLIRTSSPERAQQRLSQVKYQLKDPSLQGLQIRLSPWPEGDLAIVQRKVLVASDEPKLLPQPLAEPEL